MVPKFVKGFVFVVKEFSSLLLGIVQLKGAVVEVCVVCVNVRLPVLPNNVILIHLKSFILSLSL